MDNSVPEESVVMSDASFAGTPTPAPSSAPSPTDSGTQTSIPKIKSKGNTGKIVATIFGLLLLVGGIGAGLVLVNQQQLINQEAATINNAGGIGSAGGCVNVIGCSGCGKVQFSNGTFSSSNLVCNTAALCGGAPAPAPAITTTNTTTSTFNGSACTNACKSIKSAINGGVVGGRELASKSDGGVAGCECYCQVGAWTNGSSV